MATAAYEVAHLSEHLDAETGVSNDAPRRRGRWLVGGVGIALAIAGCMGVAVARARRPASPLAHLSTMRKRLMKAVSSRILQDGADQETNVNILWNELGGVDPDKMGVEVVAQKASDEHDSFTLRLTFGAKDEKGADLADSLKDLFETMVNAMVPADEGGDDIIKTATFSGDGDEAVMEFKPPPNPAEEQAEQEVESAFDKGLKLTASVFLGRDMQEMFDANEKLLEFRPKGIQFKANAKLASAAMDVAMEDRGMEPWEQVEHYVVKQDYDAKIFYDSTMNSDEGDASQDPVRATFKGVLGSMPDEIQDKLAALDDLADGVKTLEILGLPQNMEIKGTFTNFHLAPLIKDTIEEVKANSESK